MQRMFLVIFSLMLPTMTLAYNDIPNKFSMSAGIYHRINSGYLQTPAGGTPGTSTDKQPTYSLLDMRNGIGYQLDMGYRLFKQFILHIDGRLNHNSSTFISSKTFISQGQTFNKGDKLHATHKFNRFNTAILYDMPFNQFSLAVGPAFSLMSFGLEIEKADKSGKMDRSYNKSSIGPALGATYRFTAKTSLNASFLYTFSFGNKQPNFIDSKMTLRHMISTIGVDFFVADYLTRYTDSQRYPNQLHINNFNYGVGLVFEL